MIDLHSHILPGIDDGPPDMEGSIAFARAAVAAGTSTIVATPHVNERFGHDVALHERTHAAVRDALAAEGIALDVLLGAEIALERYMTLDEADLPALRLGDGPYLLLECPLSLAAGAFDQFLMGLLRQRVPVLLAHPERCPTFQRRPEKLDALVNAGAKCQITAASLNGDFGRAVQQYSLHCLTEGHAHVLSSDAHDAEHRGPSLQEGLQTAARERPGTGVLADWLTIDAPAAILAGERVPRRPFVTAPEPRRLGFLRRR